MNFISGYYTDVGIKKKTNQDSILILHATTDFGEAVFAAVCDGMGGLKKGEVASADVIHAFRQWFVEAFPETIPGGRLDTAKLRKDWDEIIDRRADAISRYGTINGISLGTTLTCILLFGGAYYVANVGDSRAYLFSDQVYQITHDHSVVQQKIDRGLITIEQSLSDPERSILLQCIGASDVVQPDFFSGEIKPGMMFVLCCDGFRHMISPGEMYSYLNPSAMTDERSIEQSLKKVTDLLKARRETDNISAAVVKIY